MVNGLVGVGSTDKKAKEDSKQQNYMEPSNIEIQTLRESSRTLGITPQGGGTDRTQERDETIAIDGQESLLCSEKARVDLLDHNQQYNEAGQAIDLDHEKMIAEHASRTSVYDKMGLKAGTMKNVIDY